jgi:hypothetical protein
MLDPWIAMIRKEYVSIPDPISRTLLAEVCRAAR